MCPFDSFWPLTSSDLEFLKINICDYFIKRIAQHFNSSDAAALINKSFKNNKITMTMHGTCDVTLCSVAVLLAA